VRVLKRRAAHSHWSIRAIICWLLYPKSAEKAFVYRFAITAFFHYNSWATR
jgi:hypothetical protein